VQFERDEAKRPGNIAKHGIDFASAERFDWDSAVVQEDRRQSYGEQRWGAQGLLDGVVHTLIFTRRGVKVRVISLRQANSKERTAYAKAKAPGSDR
jgi:uncharacterized DUF497 family protein